MSPTGPVVRLREVSKGYRTSGELTPVLSRVDLTLGPGEKASLIGPSGSGKSTLLSLIAGLLLPDAGTVEVDAVPTGGLDDRTRARLRAERIGIALQADNLIPFLTARENVELALAFAGRQRPSGRAGRGGRGRRALELLARFGVAHRAGHRPRHLSGGEAQRVALAVSVANSPVVLLADEIVAQLDRQTAARVIHDLLGADLAVFYVTHDRAVAELAERRYGLNDQRVEALP